MNDFHVEIIDPRPDNDRGGQHVGSVPYAVRVTHIDTEIVA